MDIIGFDTPVFDFLVHIDSFPPPDTACVMENSWQYGGKVSSGLTAAARLGASCGIVGMVGGSIGAACVADFERHEVDVSRVVWQEDAQSPLCMCFTQDTVPGRNIFLPKGGRLRRLTVDDLDKDYIQSAKVLHLCSANEATRQAAIWVREAGGKVLFDADGFNQDILDMLHLIDIFIPSEFFFSDCFHHEDYEKGLRELRGKGPGVCIVTLGEKGCAGLDGDTLFTHPAYPIKAVDTTGAGDVFHGAFAYATVKGMTVQEGALFASAVAAIKCTRIGGRAGTPRLDVVKQFMQTGVIDYTEIDERMRFYANPHMI